MAADDPRLWSYEGVLPGMDPVCHLPEGDPQLWLEWLKAAGYDLPENWREFVDRPAEGTRWRTQYRAEHTQTAFLTERVMDFVDGHRGRVRGSSTSPICVRIRRTSRPRRTTRCTTPHRFPPRCAPRHASTKRSSIRCSA